MFRTRKLGVEIAKVDGKGAESRRRKDWSLTVSTLTNFPSHTIVLRDVSDMSSDSGREMLTPKLLSILVIVANVWHSSTSSTPISGNNIMNATYLEEMIVLTMTNLLRLEYRGSNLWSLGYKRDKNWRISLIKIQKKMKILNLASFALYISMAI